jgi:hypothetical protein
MEALLDVCDEIGEGRLRPVGRRLLRRQCRVEFCNQGVRLEAMAPADILERELAAAAEVDAMALEDLDGRRICGGDVSNKR